MIMISSIKFVSLFICIFFWQTHAQETDISKLIRFDTLHVAKIIGKFNVEINYFNIIIPGYDDIQDKINNTIVKPICNNYNINDSIYDIAVITEKAVKYFTDEFFNDSTYTCEFDSYLLPGYNKNNILSIEYRTNYLCGPHPETSDPYYVAFDLRNGNILSLKDVISSKKLHELLDRAKDTLIHVNPFFDIACEECASALLKPKYFFLDENNNTFCLYYCSTGGQNYPVIVEFPINIMKEYIKKDCVIYNIFKNE